MDLFFFLIYVFERENNVQMTQEHILGNCTLSSSLLYFFTFTTKVTSGWRTWFCQQSKELQTQEEHAEEILKNKDQ